MSITPNSSEEVSRQPHPEETESATPQVGAAKSLPRICQEIEGICNHSREWSDQETSERAQWWTQKGDAQWQEQKKRLLLLLDDLINNHPNSTVKQLCKDLKNDCTSLQKEQNRQHSIHGVMEKLTNLQTNLTGPHQTNQPTSTTPSAPSSVEPQLQNQRRINLQWIRGIFRRRHDAQSPQQAPQASGGGGMSRRSFLKETGKIAGTMATGVVATLGVQRLSGTTSREDDAKEKKEAEKDERRTAPEKEGYSWLSNPLFHQAALRGARLLIEEMLLPPTALRRFEERRLHVLRRIAENDLGQQRTAQLQNLRVKLAADSVRDWTGGDVARLAIEWSAPFLELYELWRDVVAAPSVSFGTFIQRLIAHGGAVSVLPTSTKPEILDHIPDPRQIPLIDRMRHTRRNLIIALLGSIALTGGGAYLFWPSAKKNGEPSPQPPPSPIQSEEEQRKRRQEKADAFKAAIENAQKEAQEKYKGKGKKVD